MTTLPQVDFRDALQEIRRTDFGSRLFGQVLAGATLMSIQASETHYCTPRKTLDDIKAYTHWEVAIMSVADGWPNVHNIEGFPHSEKWEEQWGDHYCGVGVQVTTQEVQDIFEFLRTWHPNQKDSK